MTFGEQIQRNAVALISLTIALISLGYNSWRNEQSEANRNLRFAAFEMLQHLGELQSVTDQISYGDGAGQDLQIMGWGLASVLRDLGSLMPEPANERSQALFEAWEDHVNYLAEQDPQRAHNQQMAEAINALREQAKSQLSMLR